MNKAKLIEKIKKDLKLSWVKDGHEFDGGSAILWSGEGATIEVDSEKVAAFDYYSQDYNTYKFGVHVAILAWSEKNNLFWEAHDPGTFFAYNVDNN